MTSPPPPTRESGLSKDGQCALRRQLLIELSVLRRRYVALSDESYADTDEGQLPGPATTTTTTTPTPTASEASSTGDDTGALGQSDRDAIEALFHSVDDFAREFNEGKGELVRNDIVAKITRDAL
ncbi:hypothetical protein NESM_000072400 [Novymonas esmeraldas]|uniref:Uncharacterized protein n=1 Tax=Novymonas esmeraldas TaxID=1808958 RepID=A0AAW0F4M1_9TRYP